MSVPFEKLPYVVLIKILKFLKTSDILLLMRTNKSLHRMISQNRHRLSKRDVDVTILPEKLKQKLIYHLTVKDSSTRRVIDLEKKIPPRVTKRNGTKEIIIGRRFENGTDRYTEEREKLLYRLDCLFRHFNARWITFWSADFVGSDNDELLLPEVAEFFRGRKATVGILNLGEKVPGSVIDRLVRSVRGLKEMFLIFDSDKLHKELFDLPNILKETFSTRKERIYADADVQSRTIHLRIRIELTSEFLRNLLLQYVPYNGDAFFRKVRLDFIRCFQNVKLEEVLRGLTYTERPAENPERQQYVIEKPGEGSVMLEIGFQFTGALTISEVGSS